MPHQEMFRQVINAILVTEPRKGVTAVVRRMFCSGTGQGQSQGGECRVEAGAACMCGESLTAGTILIGEGSGKSLHGGMQGNDSRRHIEHCFHIEVQYPV